MGDEGARTARVELFTRMFRAHYELVVAYAERRTGSREDAEDIAAATFAAAWRRLDGALAEELQRSWLLSIARGNLANHHRGRRRRRLLIRRALAERPPASPAADGGLIVAALDHLRPVEQEILRLATWEGLPPVEAAAVLGLTVNAYNVRLHRARRSLRAAYEDLQEQAQGSRGDTYGTQRGDQ